jgi:uncharacterized membrane protein YfcA
MEVNFVVLVCSFFLIAVIYSSVGFGGGSSYLALLAVMGVSLSILRPAALLCNIIVVTGGTLIFWKVGAVEWRKCLPFLCASIPMAFVGGLWKIQDADFFFILLGSSLIVAAVLLWIQPAPREGHRVDNLFLNAGLGAGIGFLSGLVSIGGGIFLSPVLHLLNWAEAKKISALASLFILVNSISGLAGQVTRSHDIDWKFIAPLLVAVFFGGQIGSRLGARKFNPAYIKRITAILIVIAGIKILRDHL